MSVLPKRQNLKEISQFHDKPSKILTHQTSSPTLNVLKICGKNQRPFWGLKAEDSNSTKRVLFGRTTKKAIYS